MDSYDQQIAYLKDHPKDIEWQWKSAQGIFRMAVSEYRPSYGQGRTIQSTNKRTYR
jgi:hypothetical protein